MELLEKDIEPMKNKHSNTVGGTTHAERIEKRKENSMNRKGNIVNNKITAKITRKAIRDARSYVRPDVLGELREKLGGEEYYLFLRNTPSAEWAGEAKKIIEKEWEELHPDECDCKPNQDCQHVEGEIIF